jgi:hypothetical protein
VSGVFRTIDLPPPLHPASVSSPRTKGGGVHTRRAVRECGINIWKTPDIGLASYSIIRLRGGLSIIGPLTYQNYLIIGRRNLAIISIIGTIKNHRSQLCPWYYLKRGGRVVFNLYEGWPEKDGGCDINVWLWTAVVHHHVPLSTRRQQLPFSVILYSKLTIRLKRTMLLKCFIKFRMRWNFRIREYFR